MPRSNTTCSETQQELLCAALGLCFWLLYQFTAARTFTYDGLCYALDAQRGPADQLFHANHLLYSALARVHLKVAALLGYSGAGIYWMQSVNAFVAGAAVAWMARLGASRAGIWMGIGTAAFFGVCQVQWFEAADPGCYAWASLAVVGLLHLLLIAPRLSPWVVGLLHGVIVLFHQMLVLVAVAFALRLAPRQALRYGATLALTVSSAYGIVALIFHRTSLSDALYWALGPAGPPPGTPVMSTYWWSLDFVRNLSASWTTYVESIFGPSVEAHLFGLFLLGFAVWSTVRRFRTLPAAQNRDVIAAWAWIVTLNLFQFFFAVGMHRYRLLFLPPLLYLAFIAVPLARPRVRRWCGVGLVLLAAGIGMGNFVRTIHPRMRSPVAAARLELLRTQVQPSDFLVYAGRGPRSLMNVFLVYFAPELPARSVSGYLYAVPGGQWQELNNALDQVQAQGGRIWMETSLWEPDVQSDMERAFSLPAGHVGAWIKQFSKTAPEVRLPDGYGVVRVRRRR